MSHLRRLVLLAIAAAAMVAFAAPAMAQAEDPFWYVDGEKAGESEPSVLAEGELRFATSAFIDLRCDAAAEIEFANGSSHAEGQVTEFELSNCVNYPSPGKSCVVSSVFGSGGALSSTKAPEVDLEKFWVSAVIPGCGITELVGFAGTLQGTFSNEADCFEYEESGSLNAPGPVPIATTGSLCAVGHDVDLISSPPGPRWHVDGQLVGSSPVSLDNTESYMQISGPGFTISCDPSDSSMSIWNSEGHGRATLNLDFKDPCEAEFSGAPPCAADVSSVNSPFSLTAEEGGVLPVDSMALFMKLKGCPYSGEVTVEDSVDVVYNNETGCIEYEAPLKTPGLTVWAASEICFEHEDGPVTLG